MSFNYKSRNVLVLEDALATKRLLEYMLKELNFSPISSETRDDFLEAYNSNDYYAAILDNNVPYNFGGICERDVGVNLAYNLLREPGMRVALHTGEDLGSRIPEFKNIGLRYFQKPVLIRDLGDFLNYPKVD
ncbi:Uncharacterised protein [uncultured archaeon]|nr:Uncharacterised protein [uncultured archaeon]